jgi:hypothetical protein
MYGLYWKFGEPCQVTSHSLLKGRICLLGADFYMGFFSGAVGHIQRSRLPKMMRHIYFYAPRPLLVIGR